MNDILARRLTTQGISDPRFRTPREVVAWLGAVQAQEYPAGAWAIGLRTAKSTQADVERAVASRSIVRTWPMRGTLHFVPAADVRWMVELCAPRVLKSAANRLKNDFGIDGSVLPAARKVVIKALEGGRQVTRDGLYQCLDDAGIETGESRGLHFLFTLAHELLICFGPRQGKHPTFTLLDEWLPDAKSLPHDEALGRLARRYFTGHGPASLRDFTWWSGLTVGDARRALDLAQPLEREHVDGHELWSGPGAQDPKPSGAAYLLPAWDEYTVGYRHRAPLVHEAHVDRIEHRYGVLNPAMVRGGLVFGSWKRTLSPHQVVVKPLPYVRLTRIQKEKLKPAVKRYGLFLGIPAVLA